jgi:hypothetical protein
MPHLKTRIVSVAAIRLDSWKSVRPFKRIICDDISEFESYMASPVSRGHVPLTKIYATFPRVIETMASLCRAFFSISGDVREISSASLWSRIFNIRLLISETRFELA